MKRFWITVFLCYFIFFSVVIVSPARGHEALTGWTYPPECCGEGDCAEAKDVKFLEDGSMIITTKIGKAKFSSSFPRKASKDASIHACMSVYYDAEGWSSPYCLFVPAGS
jgi:hypothetical protein